MSACAANPASIFASTQAVLRSHAAHLLPVDMLHTSCCPLPCSCAAGDDFATTSFNFKFEQREAHGGALSYQLPFIISSVSMPPAVHTRQAAVRSASSSGMSDFFRRMMGGGGSSGVEVHFSSDFYSRINICLCTCRCMQSWCSTITIIMISIIIPYKSWRHILTDNIFSIMHGQSYMCARVRMNDAWHL